MTESHPKFRQVRVEPHELYVFSYVTDKMLRNSPTAIEAYIARAAADEINFKIGDAIFEGTGAGQPLGIINATCKLKIAKESNQPAATVKIENLRKMWNRLPVKSRSRAIWLVHQDVEPQLESLYQAVTNKAGTENVAAVSWANYYNAEANTIKGRPVKTIEYASTLGTEGDITLWDPMSYVVGRRGAMNAAMSMHLRFDYAETAFRWIFEVDGQPLLQSVITPFKGSNTLSPIITLETRS